MLKVGRPPRICRTGCQLKILLAGMNVIADPNAPCGCDEHAAALDRLDPKEIRENMGYHARALVERLKQLISEQQHEDHTAELGIDEPATPALQIPWWVRVGHRIPGASQAGARSLLLIATDRAANAIANPTQQPLPRRPIDDDCRGREPAP